MIKTRTRALFDRLEACNLIDIYHSRKIDYENYGRQATGLSIQTPKIYQVVEFDFVCRFTRLDSSEPRHQNITFFTPNRNELLTIKKQTVTMYLHQ